MDEAVVYRASLVITGRFEPADITQAVGLVPSKTWHSGDAVMPGASLLHKEAGWRLSALEREQDDTLNDVVVRLLDDVDLRRNKILDLKVEHGRCIECVVYSPGRKAVLSLSESTVRRIASLECGISIDYFQVAATNARS